MKKEKKLEITSLRVEKEGFSGTPLLQMSDIDDTAKGKLSILLHSCCGPCSTAVVERLSGTYHITVFFYNPNITEKEEYEKRKAAQIEFIEQYNGSRDSKDRISYLEGQYEPELFYQVASNLEQEPEGGRRCTVCFRLRLEKTAEIASISGFDCFGTTLSVSPHKNYELIHKIGMELGMRYGLSFVGDDFKKNSGYQRSVELSKKYKLYRQKYCGCEFSKKEIKEK